MTICIAVAFLSAAYAGPQQDPPTKPQVRSLLGRPLYAIEPGPDRQSLETDLAAAQDALAADPDNPAKQVWVARRLAYLWQYRKAVAAYTAAIAKHPQYAPLYRHRGHRYISLRDFDSAVTDLERAAALIRGRPDRVEPDGAPNELDKPLTTTAFNVHYHLALAHYLKGDFDASLESWRETMKFARRSDDNLVAVSDWMYLTLRRLGRQKEAERLLDPIRRDMDIIENRAYHRRLLMYKGLLRPEDLLDVDQASDLDLATLGYGVGNWYYVNGEKNRAVAIWKRVVSGKYWPAFGFIAAEADLARIEGR